MPSSLNQCNSELQDKKDFQGNQQSLNLICCVNQNSQSVCKAQSVFDVPQGVVEVQFSASLIILVWTF